MITRTWPYGTQRRGKVQIAKWRPKGIPDHVSSGQLIIDDRGEGHVCVGDAGDPEAMDGDAGVLTFTKGGPTGGYWKFERDKTR